MSDIETIAKSDSDIDELSEDNINIDLQLEEHVQDLFFNLKDLTNTIELFNELRHSGELLNLLHPEYNPVF